MSRLSRENKREQKHAAGSAALAAAPIDVRVPAAGPVGAWVGGVPVGVAAGEEIQQAVLNHLTRIALATGHPVRATVHDERIGYVVPLEVGPDGASGFTGEPAQMAPAGPAGAPGRTAPAGHSGALGQPAPAGRSGEAARGFPPPPTAPSPAPSSFPAPSPLPPAPPAEPEAPVAGPRQSEPERQPRRDRPTHVLRAASEPQRETAPTFPLRSVPEPQPLGENVPTFPLRAVPEPGGTGGASTFPLRAVPESAEDRAPGTVAAPKGEFGPPPPMDAVPQRGPAPQDAPAPRPAPASGRPSTSLTVMAPDVDKAADPDVRPTPARGFDAVAEAVLGDEPPATTSFLVEPMAQINEAVKAGRTEAAAGLAESAVGEASAALGPDHDEVLRLRELTAYIAYLAGDPVRSFGLSLDLARIRRRTGDAEAAYGNVQSAASAWRAVRDPLQGLELGRDLIGLWTELTTEDGPAADDIEQLESARARMGRLTERARKPAP